VRGLVAMFLLGWSLLASGQLSGQFYLEKSTYAPGEPIFLYFRVANDGPRDETINSADPYSFCAGYQITVSGDPSPSSSCAQVFVGSCFSSTITISPGKQLVEGILLNFEHGIESAGQ
jgi:hypothetical protein